MEKEMSKNKITLVVALLLFETTGFAIGKVVKFGNHTSKPIQILSKKEGQYREIKPGKIAFLTIASKSVLLKNKKENMVVKIILDAQYEFRNWKTCEIYTTNQVGIKRKLGFRSHTETPHYKPLARHVKRIKNLTGANIKIQDIAEKTCITLGPGQTKTLCPTRGTILLNDTIVLHLPVADLFEIHKVVETFAAKHNGQWVTPTEMTIKNENSATESLQLQPIYFNGKRGRWIQVGKPGQQITFDLANVKAVAAKFDDIVEEIFTTGLIPGSTLEIGLSSPYTYKHYIKQKDGTHKSTDFFPTYKQERA